MDINVRLNRSYIGGTWTEGQASVVYETVNPYDDTVITQIKLANQSQIDNAFVQAKLASKSWAKSSAIQRKQVLQNTINHFKTYEEDIVDLIVRETGSTIRKARSEIANSIILLEEAMKIVGAINTFVEMPGTIEGKYNRVYRLPVGVVTCITPFNFPLVLAMRTIAYAIALGNTVVLKPDLQTGMSGGSVIARIFELAGLPAGVINVVLTDVEHAGDLFITAPQSTFISFTGSTKVGKWIGSIAGGLLKRVALELGGNAPFVVLEDADIERAVDAAIFGTFTHQGQVCMSVNRIIVHKHRAEEFITAFVQRAKQLKAGNPTDPATIIGPLINQRQIDNLLQRINKAKQDGLELALEGERIGNIITPHVFVNVDNSCDLAQSEMFGPAVSIIKAETDDEAIALASQTRFGLSSSVFTSNIEKGLEAGLQIESGMIHINDQTVNDQVNAPFGGMKDSGIGRFGNPWVIDELTVSKWISIQRESREYPF